MTHLSRSELVRWLQAGDPGDRDRVIGHLAVCDECGRLYGEVMAAAPAEVRADIAAAARDLAPAGHRALAARPAFWSWPRVAAAAAAAILLAALAGPAVNRWIRRDETTGTIRGGSLQALSPVGSVRGPVEFQWASPFAAPRYRVEVLDAADRVIATAVVARERATWSELSATPPAEGTEYKWRVVALDSADSTIAVSNTGVFRVVR